MPQLLSSGCKYYSGFLSFQHSDVCCVTMKRRNDSECTAPLKKQKKRVAELALSLSSTSDDEPPSSVNHAAKGKLASVVRDH